MAERSLFLTNRHLQDLNPLIAGEEECESAHRFGPAVRKYTLIHYVCSGCGTLWARGNVYHVHAGQAFLILPGEVTTYEADKHTPWHYQWIGFDGSLASQFSALPPVLEFPGGIFRSLFSTISGIAQPEYAIAGALFTLYAHLFAGHHSANQHVRKVESYIQANFMQPIRVEEIARQLNLDRRYLSRLYKEKTGLSIQQYLLRTRLEESAKYLRMGYTVHDAAQLCGYEDVSNFSRMFKRYFGKSPAHYKA